MSMRSEAEALAKRLRENYRAVSGTWAAIDTLLSGSERLAYADQLRDLELIIYALERTYNDIPRQCGDNEALAVGA